MRNIDVFLIALIIAAIYCIRLSMQTQSKATDVITIYEEPVSENEYPEIRTNA